MVRFCFMAKPSIKTKEVRGMIQSPLKQREIKNHIEEVVNRKMQKVEKAYERKRETFVNKNLDKKKKEIKKELQPLIAELRKTKKEFFTRAERLNYEFGYCNKPTIDIPSIKQEEIGNLLQKVFDKENEKKKEKVREKIENKRLNIIEKILFADEKELLKLVSELKEMKIEL